jgi:ubiquinone/menaquinone biosynthesis C-methylase UbiE
MNSATTAALPPEAVVMQMVLGGWVARAISEVCRLNIPDTLKANGPLTAAQLNTGDLAVNTGALERVLRGCASVGIFTEDADGRFGVTPLSEVLTASAPGSVKAVATEIGGTWLRLLSELGETIRTGEPQTERTFGMKWWDWLNANPKELEIFGEAMKANSHLSMHGVLEKCDFSAVKKIADIGGGFGHLVIALLEKYPHLNGAVVDLPELIPVARVKNPAPEGVAGRLEYVGANMFDSVPPADAYIMKHIIHDWDDEHCQQLLRNCHRSMQGAGRLICVDSVLPPLGDVSGTPAKFLDLLMMAGIRGKERTQKQWEDLYAAAGFRVAGITPLHDNFGTSVVEGTKA